MLSTWCIGDAMASSVRSRLLVGAIPALALCVSSAATAGRMPLPGEVFVPSAFDARPAWETARLELLLSAMAQSPSHVDLPWRLAVTKPAAARAGIPTVPDLLDSTVAQDPTKPWTWTSTRWSFGSPASLIGPHAHWIAPPAGALLRDPPLVMASGGGGKDGGEGIVTGTPILPDSNPFEIPSTLEHWDVDGEGDGEPPIVVPVPTPVVLGGFGLLGAWLARRSLAPRVGRLRG